MSSLQQMIGAEDDQQRQIVDYKMVTFTLGGKDYGIDIMSVKEIYKAERLTPVPNTAPYVRGVINLRGEIISVIDLRIMFNLDAVEFSSGEIQDVIFVKVDDHLVGVVVDLINDVVGIDSATIQPPHPLFGDINIKYISGVVEYDERLFIILDTDAIFGANAVNLAPTPKPLEMPEPLPVPSPKPDAPEEGLDFSFITETLFTFRSFVVSEVNEEWVKTRFEEWRQAKGPESASIQLKSPEDADEFLRGFLSSDTSVLWPEERAMQFSAALPETAGNLFSAWEIGCGNGHEAYSMACALKAKLPGKSLKIWAHDSDLLKVSNAPNMVFRQSELPPWLRSYTVEGAAGSAFSKEIADSILFEYHDVLHENQLPPVNLIVVRDILSYLSAEARTKLMHDFREKLVDGGILIVGDNEVIQATDGWTQQQSGSFTWYAKS